MAPHGYTRTTPSKAAFFMMDTDRAGTLVEYGETSQIFTNPKDKRTEYYITGRIG